MNATWYLLAIDAAHPCQESAPERLLLSETCQTLTFSRSVDAAGGRLIYLRPE